jgi:hypothetical protein
MIEDYEGHHIHASGWYLAEAKGWEPRLILFWFEGGQVKQIFHNPAKEAEDAGLALAKKWIIDDGKPPLADQVDPSNSGVGSPGLNQTS